MNWRVSICILLALSLISSGCTSRRRIIGSVKKGLGRAAADGVEKSVYDSTSPGEPGRTQPSSAGWNRRMTGQARLIFSRSFSVGGYWPGRVEYQPGEWTKYRITKDGSSDQFAVERALLKRTSDGNEWWRLSWTAGDKNWTYEALIETQNNRLVRLRGRDPEGNTSEIPVEKETFLQPTREINEESISGATTGTVELTTEAGSFSSRRVKYGTIAGSGQLTWWLNDEIPGGVVKYVISAPDGSTAWNCRLTDFGSGAETRLDSY